MHTAANTSCRLIAVQDLIFSIFLITIFKANGLISSGGANNFSGGASPRWPRAGYGPGFMAFNFGVKYLSY